MWAPPGCDPPGRLSLSASRLFASRRALDARGHAMTRALVLGLGALLLLAVLGLVAIVLALRGY